MCAQWYMCVYVRVLSFKPRQHTKSWKLQPDIHKQWPHKTMQTRCLGSPPCPHVQQLAELLLPSPTPSLLQHKSVPKVWIYANTQILFPTSLYPDHSTFKAPLYLSPRSGMLTLKLVRAVEVFLESPAITSGRFEAECLLQCSINILRVLFESNIHLA